jgi:hypothetical protein
MKVVRRLLGLVLPALVVSAGLGQTAAAVTGPTTALVVGEIERITLDTPTDVWSGGTIVLGHQNVIIPRNLLIDLPANRLSLQQLFMAAPAACQGSGESGLAKADRCNASGSGGIASIAANRTRSGNVIAGDVFIQKGIDSVSGVVTFINYDQGYFRLNGNNGDDSTGVMVRLNDPTGRHTVQLGQGCAGGPNCSADPRFTEDPDNYTNAFVTGYPMCLPSTVKRTFDDTLNFNGSPGAKVDAQARADGTGDVLCPVSTNRASLVAGDSRRLAPLVLGDHLVSTGNFETVGGVRFLSAWKTTVSTALTTRSDPGQPDYVAVNSAFINAPAFQGMVVQAQFKGIATLDPDVMLWSVHRDPLHNAPHEFPLASVTGCDNAVAPGTCAAVGLAPGNTLWSVNYAVDLRLAARPISSPCAQLRGDPRFSAANPCPKGGTLAEMFSVLSPMPREIQARTGRKFADLNGGGGVLKTLDVKGAAATNGQFLFPFGIGLGGINIPAPLGFAPDALATPFSFSGLPWALDRRLSPGGCLKDPCEDSAPAPLDPFPFEGIDPRTQAPVPTDLYSDGVFTRSSLAKASNRILSFVDGGIGNFNGDSTVLRWPPFDSASRPIVPTPSLATSHDIVMGVTPARGVPGTKVVIDGTNLAGARAVTFGGVPADPATVHNVDNLHVAVVVPNGALTGPVGVTTSAGSLTTTARFAIVGPPTVAGLNPANAPAGASITITGTGLDTALDVAFNGTSTTFSVLSDAAIRAVVPSGASSGTVTITTVGGKTNSATSFTVQGVLAPVPSPPTTLAPAPVPTPPTTLAPAPVSSPPTISGFSPAAGAVGATVTLTGSGFSGAKSVTFNGQAAAFTVASDTSITAPVPAGATTGPVSVSTPAGTATTTGSFNVS